MVFPASKYRSHLIEAMFNYGNLLADGRFFRNNSHHTVTGLFDLDGTPILAKHVNFLQKRFLSRLRYNVMPSRGHWSAFMAWLLETAGFHTPKVLGSGEVRRNGLLTESYLFTEAITPTPSRQFLGVACEKAIPLIETAACFLNSLRKLHDAGITHGDLKLDNFYVLSDGVIGYWDLDSALYWPKGVPALLRYRHTSYLIANLMREADALLPAASLNAYDFIASCAKIYGNACSLQHLLGFLRHRWLKNVHFSSFI